MRVLLTALILLVTTTVHAATYYVSTTGNDSNNGLTVDLPKRTIAHAVNIMVAGDTTYVMAGTYSEGLIQFLRSGTSSQPIQLAAMPGTMPTINFVNGMIGGYVVGSDKILIQNASGFQNPIGWITVQGFEIKGGQEGIKMYNCHDCIFQNNWIHDNGHGILGNGTRVRVERNIINHNGQFEKCAAGLTMCNGDHGVYFHGTAVTIVRNLFYDNMGYGVQQNGSSSSVYSSTKHPSAEFATAANWIVSDNTFAYSRYRAGIVVWGGACDNSRYENNIFYENAVTESSGTAQGIACTSCSGSTGLSIRNNHAYASGSGGQSFKGPGFDGGTVDSGNVVNVSAPAFVNGGTNSLPASPDFRLTASSPVNIARTNEFLNNSTAVVGAFKTIADPTASIHANIVTLTFPMSTAVPIQVPAATGVSIGCTGSNCPGSPAVSTATRKTGTDSQVEVTISGIASNACVATNQTWTISYDSSTGGWTGFDNVGPYAGLNQKVFSFTSLAVTNLCDGSGPASYPGGYHVYYKLNEGTGINANDESANNLDGTVDGAWGTGKTGAGVVLTAGASQEISIDYGSGVNVDSQDLTIAFGVNVPAGGESATRFEMGPAIGANQRFYICARSGTWRVSVQGTVCSATSASNLTVSAGWNYLTLRNNSATNTVTLYKDAAAGTGGATATHTGFTLASNFLLGRVDTNTAGGGTYDDLIIYTSLVDPATLYAAWNAVVASVGTFGMPSSRFQAVYLPELGGSPTNLTAAINEAKTVVQGGAVAVLLEWYCENIANCEQTAPRLEARQNGAGSWIQVPDMETDTHIWMWGADANTLLNAGATTSRLSAGSCTVTNGVTILTSAQVPVVDLPQDGCVVLRYIVRIGATASGYYDLRLSQQNGNAFTGTVNPARITVIGPQASAGP